MGRPLCVCGTCLSNLCGTSVDGCEVPQTFPHGLEVPQQVPRGTLTSSFDALRDLSRDLRDLRDLESPRACAHARVRSPHPEAKRALDACGTSRFRTRSRDRHTRTRAEPSGPTRVLIAFVTQRELSQRELIQVRRADVFSSNVLDRGSFDDPVEHPEHDRNLDGPVTAVDLGAHRTAGHDVLGSGRLVTALVDECGVLVHLASFSSIHPGNRCGSDLACAASGDLGAGSSWA